MPWRISARHTLVLFFLFLDSYNITVRPKKYVLLSRRHRTAQKQDEAADQVQAWGRMTNGRPKAPWHLLEMPGASERNWETQLPMPSLATHERLLALRLMGLIRLA